MKKGATKKLAFPYVGWMVVFTLIPLLLIFYYAVSRVEGGFTFEHIIRVFNPNETTLRVLWKTVRFAVITTVICLLLGYPVAYIMASKEFSAKTVLLFLFIAPMWMNSLLRTYAMMTLLEGNGLINSVIGFFQNILNAVLGTNFSRRFQFLYTDGAVLLGLVYNFLPFMILPIYTVLAKMDTGYIEAAQDLGANPFKVFLRIIMPLSIPGVISGVTMVFMPAVSTFVIPTLLGGGQFMLTGNQIERNFILLNDWRFGSALSLVLMIIILFSMSVLSVVDKNKDKDAERGAMGL